VESLPRPSEIIDMLGLNRIAVFVRVAQLCSFSRAAHALGMPVSTVSRRVSVLEGDRRQASVSTELRIRNVPKPARKAIACARAFARSGGLQGWVSL